MPDPDPDDPWLVVGRRGRARPATAPTARRPQHALADDFTAPPAPLAPEATTSRPRGGRTATPDLAAAVAAWEPPIAAAGWWAGLARAMAAATRAAAAASEEEAGETAAQHFPWAEAAGLLVLGLGSLEGPCPGPARAQAALARLLARHLTGLRADQAPAPFRLIAADPVFTPADAAALACLGFEVLPPESALAVLKPDGPPPAPWVAYLPHCEPGLTERVLGAAGVGSGGGRSGGRRHAHACLALLGNSFSALAERWACALPNGRGGGGGRPTDPHASARPDRALRLVEARRVVEVGLAAAGGGGGGGGAASRSTANASTLASAFGDTALHLFLPDT